MRIFFSIILTYIILLSPTAVFAKLIDPDGLLLKIIEGNEQITQFDFDIENKVFNPERIPLEEDTKEVSIPYEIPDKSFLQNIIFIRDSLVIINTTDASKDSLHIYINEFDQLRVIPMTEDKAFSLEDIYFYPLIFYTKNLFFLIKDLQKLGITSRKVTMKLYEDNFVYQLGENDEFILVDSNDYRVLELRYKIQIKGRYYPITAKFNYPTAPNNVEGWDIRRTKVPNLIKYYIKSRLFKESIISNVVLRKVWRYRTKFIKKFKYLIETNTAFNIKIDYSR